VTPGSGGQPTYRAYVVAESDPAKAQAIVARHLRTDEVAHILAVLPDVLQHIPGLERGGALRL
jgi:hypothetical protein